jgi:hypothetical protein
MAYYSQISALAARKNWTTLLQAFPFSIACRMPPFGKMRERLMRKSLDQEIGISKIGIF